MFDCPWTRDWPAYAHYCISVLVFAMLGPSTKIALLSHVEREISKQRERGDSGESGEWKERWRGRHHLRQFRAPEICTVLHVFDNDFTDDKENGNLNCLVG